LGYGMGQLPVNMGSGMSALFLRKKHALHDPTGGSDIER
jgi:hypothetical protein